MDIIECLLSAYPLYSEDLKLDLSQPSGPFQWFLASILFGARISEKIAARTYRTFQEAGIDTPVKILSAGWDELVRILDSGGYMRYDFSTATKLINIMSALKERYRSQEELRRQSSDPEICETVAGVQRHRTGDGADILEGDERGLGYQSPVRSYGRRS